MSTKGRAGRRVTDTERELWDKVTQSVKPLTSRTKAQAPTMPEPRPPAVPMATTGRKPVAARQVPEAPAPTAKKPGKTGPQSAFEPKKARKIAAGKLSIDASIDLHGMRQADAKATLRVFLAGAQARSHRHVRVITGKGRPEAGEVRPFQLFDDTRRGMLRRLVPQWLGEPELAAVVVGFGPAGRGQGGEGALIVHIRRVRKAG